MYDITRKRICTLGLLKKEEEDRLVSFLIANNFFSRSQLNLMRYIYNFSIFLNALKS